MSQYAVRSQGQAGQMGNAGQQAERRAEAQARRTRLGQRMLAVIAGVIAAFALVILILLGSRGFQWFDAALIGYAVGSIFAFAAVTYKYTFWLMRPQTGRYFKRGWQLFFSLENFRRYTTLIPSAIFTGLLAQTFIRKRSMYRWITHLCIFWGVVLSVAITFPLTFGWLRFTQAGAGQYRIWAVGFPLFPFDPYSVFGFFVYHALVFTSLPLLLGLILAFHRRFHDIGAIAVQRFGFDIVPLALLFAIVITGLVLTADSTFFNGAYYWFISLTHEAVVVIWLISLPFGKFFHILERPATVGIELYWRASEDSEPRTCPRCGIPFAPARFVNDLKRTLNDIGQNYSVTNAAPSTPAAGQASNAALQSIWWQDFCPDCKRVMRGEANLAALGREGNQFL
ncbi:MAG: MFS transporter [Ktedonobacterales bacterium]